MVIGAMQPAQAASGSASTHAKDPAPAQVVEMKVVDTGFEPKQIDVKPGTNVTLNITRTSDLTCSTKILVPSKKITKDLPLGKTVAVNLGVVEKGEIKFGCDMNLMDHGMISVK